MLIVHAYNVAAAPTNIQIQMYALGMPKKCAGSAPFTVMSVCYAHLKVLVPMANPTPQYIVDMHMKIIAKAAADVKALYPYPINVFYLVRQCAPIPSRIDTNVNIALQNFLGLINTRYHISPHNVTTHKKNFGTGEIRTRAPPFGNHPFVRLP